MIERIKDWIKEKEMSNRDVAQKTGIQESYLSTILTGRKKLSQKKIEELKLGLGIPDDWFAHTQTFPKLDGHKNHSTTIYRDNMRVDSEIVQSDPQVKLAFTMKLSLWKKLHEGLKTISSEESDLYERCADVWEMQEGIRLGVQNVEQKVQQFQNLQIERYKPISIA